MRCRRSPWWMTLVIGVLVVLQSWLPAQAATGRTRALLFEPNARLIPIE